MNITPHAPIIPIPTVANPPTESLRRDNHQKEIITQVTAINPSAAEKSVASEKERARTPSQSNEQIDFTGLKKQAEHEVSEISDQSQQQDTQGNQEENKHEHLINTHDSENDPNHEHDEAAQAQEVADSKIINELQIRDQEVRAHELAHATTGGAATGAPSYTFEVGPDGKQYAVGGEVSVDLSPVAGDPRATITKMQKVHAAALAPVNPSAQDIKVAASATQNILAAQSEILSQEQENSTQSTSSSKTTLNGENLRNASEEFDILINKTLSDQKSVEFTSIGHELHSKEGTETITSQNLKSVQTAEVQQRSKRIESFYSNISQGYEKPNTFQFELTA